MARFWTVKYNKLSPFSPLSNVFAVPKYQLFSKQRADTKPVILTLQAANGLIKPQTVIFSYRAQIAPHKRGRKHRLFPGNGCSDLLEVLTSTFWRLFSFIPLDPLLSISGKHCKPKSHRCVFANTEIGIKYLESHGGRTALWADTLGSFPLQAQDGPTGLSPFPTALSSPWSTDSHKTKPTNICCKYFIPISSVISHNQP